MNVKVGVYENPPKIYLNENGEVSGFYADLINAIAEKEGWNVEYVFGTWEEGLKKTETGEIDFMVDVAVSEERLKRFAFNNETTLLAWGVIYSNKDVEIQSFMDLKNKRIAVMKDSIVTNGRDGIINLTFNFDINASFIFAEDYKGVFKLVESDAADVGAVNSIFGESYSKVYNVKKTPIIFQPAQLKFAFPKNSTNTNLLIERIDADLKEMKLDQNSEYYQALTKHITGYVGVTEKIPTWIYILLISGGVIILILVVSASIFMRQKKIINKSRAIIETERNKLEKSNRLKDLFIDIMRHDLLNPTGAIAMNVEIALTIEKDHKNKELLKVIEKDTNKLSERIKNAALLSRLEEGKEELEFNKVNLREVTNSVIREVSHLAKDHKIKITSKIKDNFFVEATPLIHDVFFNLVTNAIKYSHEGKEVILDINEKNNKYFVSVSDRGKGIADKYKKSIFERFTRLEKGGIEGSGLGLSITKKILEIHHGRIWVEDNPKGGSVFIVELPYSSSF